MEAARAPKRGRRRDHSDSMGRRRLFGVLGVVIVLGIWELGGRAGLINPLMFSSPRAVYSGFTQALSQGWLLADIRASGTEIILGLGFAIVIGVVVGFVSGLNRWVFFAVDPWVTILYALPTVAIAPLLINIMGIGLSAKVLVVLLFGVFPIIINTQTGVHASSKEYLNVAQVYGARKWRVIKSVIFPGAVPYIMIGIRLAGARALVGMVVAEFIASDVGIGYRLKFAGSLMQTGLLIAMLILLGLVGVIYASAIRRLDNRLSRWRPDQRP